MLKGVSLVCLIIIVVLSGSFLYTCAVVITDTMPKKEREVLVTSDGCTTYKWYDKGERMYQKICKK